MTTFAAEPIPAAEIDRSDYKRTYSADQDELRHQHKMRELQPGVSKETIEFVAQALRTDLSKLVGDPDSVEVVSDTEGFPNHNPDLVSLYRDEANSTDRLMVDSYAAIHFANTNEDLDKNTANRIVPGYKHVLSMVPLEQSALNKAGIKQGIKLEYIPIIKSKIIGAYSRKQDEIEQEARKVYKDDDKKLEDLKKEHELLGAALVFFNAVLKPPKESPEK